MAEAMLSIINESKKSQEQILKRLSETKIEDETVGIEVNGCIYKIPKAVMGLIDSLHEEVLGFRGNPISGIKENKEN